jgi:hypothetical protein
MVFQRPFGIEKNRALADPVTEVAISQSPDPVHGMRKIDDQ